MISFVGPTQVHEMHASSGVWEHLSCILKCLTYKSLPQTSEFMEEIDILYYFLIAFRVFS